MAIHHTIGNNQTKTKIISIETLFEKGDCFWHRKQFVQFQTNFQTIMMCFKCNLIPFKICCASWIENKSFICSDSCVWASPQTTIELAPSPSHFYCIVTCGANQLEPIWPPAHLPPHLGLSITAFDANLNCISPLFPAQQLRFALRDQWRPPRGENAYI